MSNTQKSIAWGLFGILLFSMVLFRSELFVQSEWTVLLNKILAPAAVLLMIVACARLLRVRWFWLLLPVLAVEAGVFITLQMAKSNAALPGSLLYFAQEVYSANERNIPSYNEQMGRYDSTLFYTLQPGVHTFNNLEFSTTMKVNKAGFRDDDASLEQPSIVCLGDSYALGWGVEGEETYPDLLEKKLGRKTLNLGMASYGTAREYVAFKKYVPQDCDLIILQYCGNDEEENAAFVQSNFQLHISSFEQYQQAQLRNKLWRNYFPLKYFYAAVSFGIRETWRLITHRPKSEAVAHLPSLMASDKMPKWAEHFFKILTLLKEHHDGKIVVFYLDNHNTFPWYHNQLDTWLSTNKMEGVYFFQADTLLTQDDYFNLDDHLRPSGHYKLAKGLAKFISDNHILD